MDILKPIHPDYVRNGIDTVIWIHPSVPADRERRVLMKIEEALAVWESVPASSLKFRPQVVRHDEPVSSFPSWRVSGQLLIIVHQTGVTPVAQGDMMDYTGGGTANGLPGHVKGVPADADWKNPVQLSVLIHELGHAIGFWHTSLGVPLISNGCPMMHWSAAQTTGPRLTLDDMVAIHEAYPCTPAQLPTRMPGRSVVPPSPSVVRGVCVSGSPAKPVSGVHVVVNRVENGVGIPVASRLSGPRATGEFGQRAGEFRFAGLPTGTYRLDFMDGSTVAKNHNRLDANCLGIHPQDGGSSRLLSGFQADNFHARSVTIRVRESQSLMVPPVDLAVGPIGISEYHLGASVAVGNQLVSHYTPLESQTLPDASVGVPYSLWLPVSGGVRPVSMVARRAPAALQVHVRADPRPMMDSVYGKEFIHLSGTFAARENHKVVLTLEDRHGNRGRFSYRLAVV